MNHGEFRNSRNIHQSAIFGAGNIIAASIRNTLIEVSDRQEHHNQRRHQEVMNLIEKYFTEDKSNNDVPDDIIVVSPAQFQIPIPENRPTQNVEHDVIKSNEDNDNDVTELLAKEVKKEENRKRLLRKNYNFVGSCFLRNKNVKLKLNLNLNKIKHFQ